LVPRITTNRTPGKMTNPIYLEDGVCRYREAIRNSLSRLRGSLVSADEAEEKRTRTLVIESPRSSAQSERYLVGCNIVCAEDVQCLCLFSKLFNGKVSETRIAGYSRKPGNRVCEFCLSEPGPGTRLRKSIGHCNIVHAIRLTEASGVAELVLNGRTATRSAVHPHIQ
jgi:hypothetical protein